jgi:diguanylate cyclase (GGDEF)-like protein
VLYEVSNAMRTTLDLKHILYIILTGVTAHTGLGFNRAILFLVNNISRSIEPQMAIGPESLEHAQKIWEYISRADQRLDDLIQEEKLDQDIGQKALFQSIKQLKIPLSTTKDNLLIASCIDGSPKHIPQEQILEYVNDPLLQVFKTNELVIMPLKVKDRVNGLIIADNLYTRKPITEDDLKIFAMLANQAGLAIENSRLYEMTKHKSHTDAITGLWNHGFFQDKLTEEIVKASKSNEKIGLMMIDVDNFKKLNDNYGHQNGDVVLKEIANILRESSRDGDYVCRYGGEEFSIILTQAGPDQGYQIAERIRQEVEKHPLPKFSSDEQLTVTVSIGLALFPNEGTDTKESLISRADKAMYTAKLSGKNQTCLA